MPSGVRLASLRDAIVHLVNTVPSAERGMPVILTAAELITSAAEHGGPIEFARIATLRAINRHVGRAFAPARKDPHWGRRKLKRGYGMKLTHRRSEQRPPFRLLSS